MLRRQTVLLFLLLLLCACATPVWAQRPTGDCNYRDGRGWVRCEDGPSTRSYTPPPPDPAVLEAQRKAREATKSNDAGLAATAREDLAAAEENFVHAVELAPDNRQYRYNLFEVRRKRAEIADRERERREKLERDEQELLPKIKSVSNDGVTSGGPVELKFKTVTAETRTSSQPKPQPRIGAAANVSGDVSVIREGQRKPVKIGPGFAISANDHVVLGPDGHLQVLLLDETVFTLGPNSDMVLDEFVYDPPSGLTKLAARINRGIFRFVSGHAAKETPDSRIRIRNAVGVGIRGTDFDLKLDESGKGSITLHSGAIDLTDLKTGKVRAMRPGETVIFNDDGIVVPPPSVVRRRSPRTRSTGR